MSWRQFRNLVSDLFNVLPGRVRPEWQEIHRTNGGKPTVVLVSGFAATNRSLSIIRKRLLRDGFNVIVVALDWQALADSVRGLYRMAEKLSSVILDLRKGPCRGDSRIFIVAHSAGGLVARYYIQLLGGFHYCDGMVTLGTPHQGTWIAILGLFCHLILKFRCLIQMLPLSPFIRKLNAAPFPQGFHCLSIASDADFLCPRSTTRVPILAVDPGNFRSIDLTNLSHGELLMSKTSYRMMLQYLQQEAGMAIVPPKAQTRPVTDAG